MELRVFAMPKIVPEKFGRDVQAVPQVAGGHSAVHGQSGGEDGHGRNAVASVISLGDHQ